MVRKLICILYVPLFLIANTVTAGAVNSIVVHPTPKPVVDVAVTNENGDQVTFGESDTALRMVNLWALWCVSCRKEMPTLDALTEQYDPSQLQIETVAIGRNDPQKVALFFEDIGVIHLPVLYDPKQKYAAAVGAVGLPHTIFLNSKGEEIARVIGEANYIEPEMVAQIEALLKAQN